MTQRRNWIKLYVDQSLRGTMMKELPYDERWVWIGLLLLAGDSPFEGKIAISEIIGYTDEQIAGLLETPIDVYISAKEKMIKHDKISINENGIIKITNWKKYQSEYGRLKKYRESHESTTKSTTKSTSNSHSREREGDRDRERDKKEEIREEVYNLLLPIKGRGPDKAEKLTDFIVDELIPEFPEIDALEQIKRKITWWKDHPITKKSNLHSQMRNWFIKAQQFLDEKKRDDKTGTTPKKELTTKEKELQRLLQEAEEKILKANPGKRGPELEKIIQDARAKTSQEFWKEK